MFSSLRYAHIFIRVGFAILFAWFGIHKLLIPEYWTNNWMPDWLISSVSNIGISGNQIVYLIGIFEILVALSLLTGVFLNTFAVLAILFLAGNIVAQWDFRSFNEIIIRDIVLIATLVGLLMWPN